MSTQEYLSVLVSIVVGLGLSHVLTGVGNLVVDRARVRFYWVWACEVLLVFLAHVQFWWSTFGLGSGVVDNFFGFFFFLLAPIALFLMAVLAVPDFEGEGPIDLRAHFFAHHRWFFGIAATVPVLNAARAVLLEGDALLSEDRAFEAVFTTILVAGAVVSRPRFHEVLSVAILGLFAAMIVITSLQPG